MDKNEFKTAYMETLTWASSVYNEEDDYVANPVGYGFSDNFEQLSNDDCDKFLSENHKLLSKAITADYTLAMAAQDFALSRNFNNEGFLSSDIEHAKELDASAKSFGMVTLRIEDGFLFIERS